MRPRYQPREKLGDWARPNISKHWNRMNRESKPPLYHGGRDDMRWLASFTIQYPEYQISLTAHRAWKGGHMADGWLMANGGSSQSSVIFPWNHIQFPWSPIESYSIPLNSVKSELNNKKNILYIYASTLLNHYFDMGLDIPQDAYGHHVVLVPRSCSSYRAWAPSGGTKRSGGNLGFL